MAGMLSYRSCPRSESHTVRSLLDFSSSLTFFEYDSRHKWFKMTFYIIMYLGGISTSAARNHPRMCWIETCERRQRQHIEDSTLECGHILLFTINSQCLLKR